jgi:DNA invertase Pin-like site-specific DNA recombinase
MSHIDELLTTARRFGYIRYNNPDQDFESQQWNPLVRAGVPALNIRLECAAGLTPGPELLRLIAEMPEGSELNVVQFDRLVRPAEQVALIYDNCAARRITVKSLTQPEIDARLLEIGRALLTASGVQG